MLVIQEVMDEPLRLSGSEKGNLVAGTADGDKGQSVVDDLKQFLPVYERTMDSTLERFSI
ncbi:unnamed protein product [Musa banksii]